MKKIFKLILCAAVLVPLLQGCGGRPVVVPARVEGLPLKDVCGRYNVQWQWDGVTQVVMLEYKDSKAKALVGSNMVLRGKDKVLLSAPLRRSGGMIYVPEDFESKVLVPFGVMPGKIGFAQEGVWKIHKIAVDAGHGGKDPGARGLSGVLEKDVVLDIAKRLKDLLIQAGMDVVMTRDADEFITLPERTEIATNSGADLFLSVHANANAGRRTRGVEVYYVKTQSKNDLDEEQRAKNEKNYVRRLKASDGPVLAEIIGDMMYHLKVAESARLAEAVAQRTTAEIDAPNRGVKPCRFFVVRNTLIPAVLVEVGYLTNYQEEKKLKTDSYRQKIAEGIARSVLDYAID